MGEVVRGKSSALSGLDLVDEVRHIDTLTSWKSL